MIKTKKDSKSLNCNIDRAIWEKLEKYCDEVGQTKTLAVERILNQFFAEYYGCKNAGESEGVNK